MRRCFSREQAESEAKMRAKSRPGVTYCVALDQGLIGARPWRVLSEKEYRRALVLPAAFRVRYGKDYGFVIAV